MIGTWEIVFTLFIVLLLFGGKRLPELAKSLGQGIREFKKASQEISEELDSPSKVKTIDTTPLEKNEESNDKTTQTTAQ